MEKYLMYLLLLLPMMAFAVEDLEDAQRAISRGDYAEAYCLIKPMAENDNPQAQYQLGWMYHNGYGLAVDDFKARYWWQKAAEAGITNAQLALVMLYREGGVDVKKNLSNAAKYLVMAASSGDEEGRMLLSHYLNDPEWRLEKRLAKLLRSRPESLGDKVYINTDQANLREKPDRSSRVLETVNKGEKLVRIATRGDWVHAYQLRKKRFVWTHKSLVDTLTR